MSNSRTLAAAMTMMVVGAGALEVLQYQAPYRDVSDPYSHKSGRKRNRWKKDLLIKGKRLKSKYCLPR
jgi:hypothetical protein